MHSPRVGASQHKAGAALMVIEQVVVAVAPVESVTRMLKVPAELGVPVIAPVVPFTISPAGKPNAKV